MSEKPIFPTVYPKDYAADVEVPEDSIVTFAPPFPFIKYKEGDVLEPSHNSASDRMNYQHHYFANAEQYFREDGTPNVLNIGCADDPLEFGDRAFHFDIDDWSTYHKYFKQGDAHDLPFPDQAFDTVIVGDVHEHVLDPELVTREAARVTKRILCMTIFEEWLLPGPGQWIQEGHDNSDKASQELGFKDRIDFQDKMYPGKITVPDDDKTPHLPHINQFTDADIMAMIVMVVDMGFEIREAFKQPEAEKDGHQWYNWLVALERIGAE